MLIWPTKAPGDTFRYAWLPPLAAGDGLASYTLSAAGATIDASALQAGQVVAFVSGGTTGTTATITAYAVSNGGEVYNETIYLPIQASTAALTETASDVCLWALAKIVGLGRTPPANAQDRALAHFNGMLASWAAQGADVGVPLPMTAATALRCPDAFVQPLRDNLTAKLGPLFGYQVEPQVLADARSGLALVKTVNLSPDRAPAVYY